MVAVKVDMKEHSSNHHSIHTEIVIDGPVDKVWSVLMDFERIKDWSDFFCGFQGDHRDGANVTTCFASGGKQYFDERTLSYDNGRSFGFSGYLSISPGIHSQHDFQLEALDNNRTRFIQIDHWKGTDSRINTKILAEASEPSFNQFNQALKAEVEKK